jgi:chromosome partitioning protein
MDKKTVSIAVLNHKGGVAKTATTSGLASGLITLNPDLKILIIDADEQSNIKTIFGIKLKDSNGSLASVLTDNVDPTKCVYNIRPGIDVILSGARKLREFNTKFANYPKSEEIMRTRFNDKLSAYDYIIIDCPPSLSLISSNVALYADYVLIPTAPDLLSIVAAKATVTFLEEMKSAFGDVAEIIGAVPTLHDTRRNMDLDIIDDLERLAECGLLKGGRCFSEVRMDAKFKTSQLKRKLIHEAFPKSNVAIDYLTLAEEVIVKVNELELIKNSHKTITGTTSENLEIRE